MGVLVENTVFLTVSTVDIRHVQGGSGTEVNGSADYEVSLFLVDQKIYRIPFDLLLGNLYRQSKVIDGDNNSKKGIEFQFSCLSFLICHYPKMACWANKACVLLIALNEPNT